MSVTSSGRSSIRRMMRSTSGWLALIAFAMSCRMIVLPARGGETMSPRDRGQEVHDPRLDDILVRLEDETLVRIERRQVLEVRLRGREVRPLVVDGVDLEQGEIPLPVLRRPDLAGEERTAAQAEPADLAGGDVDVVRRGGIGIERRAQEAESVR
jgi:hypothetical protein